MSKQRRLGLGGVVGLLSLFLFVFIFGMSFMFLFGSAITPLLLGPPDRPFSHNIELSLFLITVVTSFPVGAFLGGVIWVAALGLVLPRDTMLRVLYFGPQIPLLTEFLVDVLDTVTGHKDSA
jgi:hypothetical protein